MTITGKLEAVTGQKSPLGEATLPRFPRSPFGDRFTLTAGGVKKPGQSCSHGNQQRLAAKGSQRNRFDHFFSNACTKADPAVRIVGQRYPQNIDVANVRNQSLLSTFISRTTPTTAATAPEKHPCNNWKKVKLEAWTTTAPGVPAPGGVITSSAPPMTPPNTAPSRAFPLSSEFNQPLMLSPHAILSSSSAFSPPWRSFSDLRIG
jgi:hypothetical protein